MDTINNISVSADTRRKIARLVLVIALLLVTQTTMAQTAIGQWRDHFSYNKALCLAPANGRIYCGYEQCVGYYDSRDDIVGRLTKVDQLSDAGIATIAYDNATATLVVAYTNSNIDIVRNDITYNISDLKRSANGGDKTIYSIAFCRGKAYIACGIGILIVDPIRAEIETTCIVGINGTQQPVLDLTTDDSRIYAATATGIVSISQSDRFPNIATHWQHDTTSALAGRHIARIASNNGRLMALVEGIDPMMRYLYSLDNGVWQAVDSGDMQTLRCANGYTTVAFRDSVRVYAPDNTLSKTYRTFRWGNIDAHDAIRDADGTLWIAHDWGGVVRIAPDGSSESLNPRGNVTDHATYITAYNDITYICPGGKTNIFTNMWRLGNLYNYKNGEWNQLDRNGADTLLDFLCVAINPRNTSQMAAASWGFGIVEIIDNKIVNVFNESNSNGAITAYHSSGWRHVRTASVAYDRKGTLWATNSLAENGLVAHYSDGTWRSFETRTLTGNNEIDHLVCDSLTDYKWITGSANRIYVLDGEGHAAYVDPNNGSRLQTNRINCLVQDRSGDLWIGTDKGIKVIFDGRRAFENGGRNEKSPVNCSNIVISNGEFVEYLMAYEDVVCIAVDGANRKWVGTQNNGIYLLSSTGLDELQHFTATNSPLPSNHIIAIGIQPLSGDVFVSTDHGTVSYRSTATYGTATPRDEVHVFPNPVRPDYSGPIAISGLTNNALVHITDIAGHVVFSDRAIGGQAIWNGLTNSGESVASGVYYVFASDNEGGNRSVGKILIVR